MRGAGAEPEVEVDAEDPQVESEPEDPQVEGDAEPNPEVEVEGDRLDADESGGPDEPASPRPRTPAWRERRIVVAAVVAVVCLAAASALALSGRSSGGGGAGDDESGAPSAMTSTTVDTGGIDVDAPDGWTVAPLPDFGFGIAVPPGWEATVLSPEMLNSLERSDPAVTGFVDAAHAAAESGSVFYAAGEDRQGRVTDVKVRAIPGAGIEDIDALKELARQLAREPGVTEPRIDRVDGADRPTVRIRFRTTSQSAEGDEITAEGVETLIAGPDDIVWSILFTGEDRSTLDDVAPRVLDTFAFAPD